VKSRIKYKYTSESSFGYVHDDDDDEIMSHMHRRKPSINYGFVPLPPSAIIVNKTLIVSEKLPHIPQTLSFLDYMNYLINLTISIYTGICNLILCIALYYFSSSEKGSSTCFRSGSSFKLLFH